MKKLVSEKATKLVQEISAKLNEVVTECGGGSVIEVEGGGLESLLGQRVLLMCANYFYVGKLVGVNSTFVQLDDPTIVYDTDKSGKIISDGKPPNAPKTWFVQRSMIESYGVA